MLGLRTSKGHFGGRPGSRAFRDGERSKQMEFAFGGVGHWWQRGKVSKNAAFFFWKCHDNKTLERAIFFCQKLVVIAQALKLGGAVITLESKSSSAHIRDHDLKVRTSMTLRGFQKLWSEELWADFSVPYEPKYDQTPFVDHLRVVAIIYALLCSDFAVQRWLRHLLCSATRSQQQFHGPTFKS